MKTRKRLLMAAALTVLALGATAALASAAVWKHGGSNVSTPIEVKFSGAEFFETTEGNSMQCEEKFTLKTSGGSTGQITAFEVVKSTCKGTGTFSKCEVSTAEAKGLPWTVDVNTTDLTITGLRIKRVFKAGCSPTELDKTVNSTVTLLTPSAIASIETSGSTTGYRQFGSFSATTNSGTYGIG